MIFYMKIDVLKSEFINENNDMSDPETFGHCRFSQD